MFDDFRNKVFRDAFLEENIRNRLAFQIRALREKEKWEQRELAERAHKTQSVISRCEDPQYGKFTIRTLLDLAAAFDVALFVSFVPYTKLIAEVQDLSPEALAVSSYIEEKKAIEMAAANSKAMAGEGQNKQASTIEHHSALDAGLGTSISGKQIGGSRLPGALQLWKPSFNEFLGNQSGGDQAMRAAR